VGQITSYIRDLPKSGIKGICLIEDGVGGKVSKKKGKGQGRTADKNKEEEERGPNRQSIMVPNDPRHEEKKG